MRRAIILLFMRTAAMILIYILIFEFFFCTFDYRVILGLLKGALVAKDKLWEQGNKSLTGRSIHLQEVPLPPLF